jgi:hypothetical protein
MDHHCTLLFMKMIHEGASESIVDFISGAEDSIIDRR